MRPSLLTITTRKELHTVVVVVVVLIVLIVFIVSIVVGNGAINYTGWLWAAVAATNCPPVSPPCAGKLAGVTRGNRLYLS